MNGVAQEKTVSDNAQVLKIPRESITPRVPNYKASDNNFKTEL